MAHPSEVSEIALKFPNYVVTPENKDIPFFLGPGVVKKIKERLYGSPVIQCSLASFKESWDFNKRIFFFFHWSTVLTGSFASESMDSTESPINAQK